MTSREVTTAASPDDITVARATLSTARAVPGVVGISRGRYAIARTFGPGGAAVEGVQLTHTGAGLLVEVHVVVAPVPLLPLGQQVRMAVAATLMGLGATVAAVDVWIDTLEMTA